MRRRLTAIVSIALLATPAAAQELGVTADVEQPMARTGGDDPTASATEVDARNRPRSVDTVEDAVREVPGARTLSTGAYGSPVTLSLRGADASQTEVLFGAVPLTSADGTAFDLSSVPLWALERVEVYRGGAPAWLGVSPVGGVLRLLPREARGTEVEATAGVGSFGLGHGRAAASVRGDDVRWLATVSGTSSEGDFPILDDRRTALDPTDDVERPRQNGFLREGAGLAHLDVPLLGGRLRAVGFGLGRVGGIPGAASQPTTQTRRHEAHLLAGLAWDRTEDGRPVEDAAWRVGVSAAGAYRRRRVTDRLAEIGPVPRRTDDESLRTVLRVASAGRMLDWLEITAVLRWVHESLFPEDALARTAADPSSRDEGSVSAEARLFGRVDGVRFELRPSARLAVIGSRLNAIRLDGPRGDDGVIVAPTFRLGAAMEPVPGVTIAASASSGTRAPSMLELFGDRGFLLGRIELRPERAETFDLGVALRGREGVVRGSAEVRGFVTLASDLIRYARIDELRSAPDNVDGATLAGGELGLRGSVTRHLSVAGALTILETWTEHGGRERRLPLRPTVSAYVRPEVAFFELGPVDRLALFVDVVHVSATFWDPANQGVLPDRTRVGLGASFSTWEDRLRVEASVRDVFDQRGTDLLGFPLPGRSFWVGLTLRSR